jgi:hypothetical protein
VAFDDPRNTFGESFFAQEIRSPLRMVDPVRAPPTDIVKQRSCYDKFRVGKIAPSCVLLRTGTDCPAMGDYLRAAPGVLE